MDQQIYVGNDVDPVDWKGARPSECRGSGSAANGAVSKPKLRGDGGCGASLFKWYFFFGEIQAPFVDLLGFWWNTDMWEFMHVFQWDIMRYDKIWMLNLDVKRFVIGP